MQRNKLYQDERLNSAVAELTYYRQLNYEIKLLMQKAEEYCDHITNIKAQVYDSVRVQGGDSYNLAVELVLRWVDMTVAVENKKLDAERNLWFIRDRLDKMERSHRRVLELYYLEGYKIDKVAEIMNYSERQVQRIKTEALKLYAGVKMSYNVV